MVWYWFGLLKICIIRMKHHYHIPPTVHRQSLNYPFIRILYTKMPYRGAQWCHYLPWKWDGTTFSHFRLHAQSRIYFTAYAVVLCVQSYIYEESQLWITAGSHVYSLSIQNGRVFESRVVHFLMQQPLASCDCWRSCMGTTYLLPCC